MPLVDPNVSFEVSARHLFRHLSDPKQLRRNPLVRRFFEHAVWGRFTRDDERRAVSLIRELVVRGAERYRNSSVGASVSREAAYRRHTIAVLHCLGGEPLESVAIRLGISKRQCYRERQEVVNRIAEYVRAYEDRSKPDIGSALNEFQLVMDRAAGRGELGDLDRALRDYDDVIASDPSPAHKIEALCKRAEALLEHGDLQQSQASLAQARDLLRFQTFSSEVVEAATSAHVHLATSKLSWSAGRFDEDSSSLQYALACIDPVASAGGDRVRELLAEVLLALCDRSLTRGEFGLAHEHLVRTEAALAGVRVPPPMRRFDAMVASWSLGAKDVRFEGASTRHLSRYEALEELSALARSFISPRRSIRLAQAFMQHHASSGDHEEASSWARKALLLAKEHREKRALAGVSLGVADWMSMTPQWAQAAGLLSAADGVFPAGSPDWILLQGLWAEYALQAKRYPEAVARAVDVEQASRRMGNVRFAAAARTTIALAAHALGKQGDAKEQVHAALDVIDDFGTPWTRWTAYQAAATITGDRRHRRTANELRQRLKA